MVDGTEVGSIRMEYGQSLAGAAFPAVPEKENFDGAWDTGAIESISSDVTINAVYTKNYLLGDANNDGYVDNLDAVYILRYDASLIDETEIREIAADVNKDGLIDNLDATLVLKYVAGLIDSLE